MEAEVLIIEDDADVRMALLQLLEEEGRVCAAAKNGLEALDYLRGGNRPRLIILDLVMPVVNGWEFRIAQKADPEWSAIPIVILTAGRHSSEELAWMLPAELLPKPVDTQRLLSVIRRYCDELP